MSIFINASLRPLSAKFTSESTQSQFLLTTFLPEYGLHFPIYLNDSFVVVIVENGIFSTICCCHYRF